MSTRVDAGDAVVLHESGDFLKISSIRQHAETGQVVLLGRRLRTIKSMIPGFDGPDNEVAMMQETFKGQTSMNLAPEAFLAEDLIYNDLPVLKRNIILTNKIPHNPPTQWDTVEADFQGPVTLICRSKYSCRYNSHPQPRLRKIFQAWTNLSEVEVPEHQTISGYHLRMERRLQQRDGSTTTQSQRLRRRRQGYTVCDAFCGAGFASAGAVRAGLRVVVCFDKDKIVLKSYRANHPNVDIKRMSFFDFVHREAHKHRVDILTLSFPCQFFSPAHTTAGQNDDNNEAAWFGLSDILRAMKPRVVLIEQTSGIDRFKQHLMANIAAFRNNSYSVQAGIVRFAALGLPSTRRRYMIVAAA